MAQGDPRDTKKFYSIQANIPENTQPLFISSYTCLVCGSKPCVCNSSTDYHTMTSTDTVSIWPTIHDGTTTIDKNIIIVETTDCKHRLVLLGECKECKKKLW